MHLAFVSVFDSAAQAFMTPVPVQSIGVAIREFRDAVNKPDSPFYAHSSDFDLFHVGDFDPVSGTVSDPIEHDIPVGKRLLIRGADAKSA